jgi:pteridine reductase
MLSPVSPPAAAPCALVTGAGTRLGAAIARALAGAGYDLVAHYATSREGAEAVAAEARGRGRRALAVRADLRDGGAIDALAAAALEFGGGRLDALVHNAGVYERVGVADLDEGALERALDVNLRAPYRLTLRLRAALERAGGCVVAVTDVAAERPFRDYLPYSVSKAALAQLVRSWALELAPRVRANAVEPGAVLPAAQDLEGGAEALRASVPLGRFGAADDVARAVLFLLQNEYVTGHALRVDGGRSLA